MKHLLEAMWSRIIIFLGLLVGVGHTGTTRRASAKRLEFWDRTKKNVAGEPRNPLLENLVSVCAGSMVGDCTRFSVTVCSVCDSSYFEAVFEEEVVACWL